MQIQRIEKGFLVFGAGAAETGGGGEPLLDLGFFTVGVGDVFEGRHCSAKGVREPRGAWKNSSGKQFDGF